MRHDQSPCWPERWVHEDADDGEVGLGVFGHAGSPPKRHESVDCEVELLGQCLPEVSEAGHVLRYFLLVTYYTKVW